MNNTARRGIINPVTIRHNGKSNAINVKGVHRMINGPTLKNAFISGANNISRHKSMVNQLNIFPVPDGDTGTNMSMTMAAAANELLKTERAQADEIAGIAASALLRGARGNSGVILSLLFRGFAKGISGKESISGTALANALGLGVKDAYQAVTKPTEGTILTVARMACEKGKAAAAIEDDAVYVWSAVCKGAAEALEATPELLPVLKKAGVVDAGGKGLCLILEGMLSVFRDNVLIADDTPVKPEPSYEDDFFRNAAAEFDQDITFTYCTEFIIGKDKLHTKPVFELRAYLENIGDCVVVVDDDALIKVHVHTENPGNALQEALTYGQLLTVKIENMKEQHRIAAEEAVKATQAEKVQALPPVPPTEEIGFVAVASGEGLKHLFSDLGCTHVVSGGQTMNPSTEDIVEAVLATPAKTVYVLPNNKNIILAAEQTVPLVTDRRVIVLPTRTVPQGLSAMLAYEGESTPEISANVMMNAANAVDTGLVTFAARDSEFGGHKMKEGDILGLKNGKLEIIDKDPVHAAVRLARSMTKKGASFLTVIYGENVTEAQAEEAFHRIKSKAGHEIEVTLVNGGQPVYYFMLSVE